MLAEEGNPYYVDPVTKETSYEKPITLDWKSNFDGNGKMCVGFSIGLVTIFHINILVNLAWAPISQLLHECANRREHKHGSSYAGLAALRAGGPQ